MSYEAKLSKRDVKKAQELMNTIQKMSFIYPHVKEVALTNEQFNLLRSYRYHSLPNLEYFYIDNVKIYRQN